MYIKIGSLEIRTGKDAKGETRTTTNRDNAPQLGYQPPQVNAGHAVSTVIRHAQPARNTQTTGISLYQRRKPHPMTAAIEWPAIPEDPMSQTRLSLLVNETDERFRKYQSVDICSVRDYVRHEGITLIGKAREAFDILQELHCKSFSQIHPAVIQSLPSLYTEIFRAAKGEFNVNDNWR